MSTSSQRSLFSYLSFREATTIQNDNASLDLDAQSVDTETRKNARDDSSADNAQESKVEGSPTYSAVKAEDIDTEDRRNVGDNSSADNDQESKLERDPTSSAVKAEKSKSKKKHYDNCFNPEWLDPKSEKFKDWIKATADNTKFYDIPCNSTYKCSYIYQHETLEAHKTKYQSWKEATKESEKIDRSLVPSNKVTSMQAKIVLFLTSKNAPLSWSQDITGLFQSCFPAQKEVLLLKMYPSKANWVAKSLAQTVCENELSVIKEDPFCLLFDETSTKHYKYSCFVVRRVSKDFTQIENNILGIYETPTSEAKETYRLYDKVIIQQGIESNVSALCLDNSNAMRGPKESLMVKVQEIRACIEFPPCLLHIINICEKHAFDFIPSDMQKFFKDVYKYFNFDGPRTKEFKALQKRLKIKPTSIPQPAHTRWLSWFKTIAGINKKWEALIQYFSGKVKEKNDKPKRKRLVKLAEMRAIQEDEGENDTRTVEQVEESINSMLQNLRTFFFSIFLEDTLKNSSKYVLEFEKDDLDVVKVYDLVKDYCRFYINMIIKFEFLGKSVEFIMKTLNLSDFKKTYFMTAAEYEEEFLKSFPQIDLTLLEPHEKEAFLDNTQNYYFRILQKFIEYFKFELNIFKDLKVLSLSERSDSDLKTWQSLSNRFSYLYKNKHSDFKKEFSDFLSLDITKIDSNQNTLNHWKWIKDMQKDGKPRFNLLIKLVSGLISMPYSNAPIERSFNYLKLIKSKKRTKLNKDNLNSMMILKNITKKRKLYEYDSVLTTQVLKRVKMTLEEEVKKQNESSASLISKSTQVKIDLKKYIKQKL